MNEIEFKVKLYHSNSGEMPNYVNVCFGDKIIYEANGFITGVDALKAIDWSKVVAVYNTIIIIK